MLDVAPVRAEPLHATGGDISCPAAIAGPALGLECVASEPLQACWAAKDPLPARDGASLERDTAGGTGGVVLWAFVPKLTERRNARFWVRVGPSLVVVRGVLTKGFGDEVCGVVVALVVIVMVDDPPWRNLAVVRLIERPMVELPVSVVIVPILAEPPLAAVPFNPVSWQSASPSRSSPKGTNPRLGV
jgi:hypothetical protein